MFLRKHQTEEEQLDIIRRMTYAVKLLIDEAEDLLEEGKKYLRKKEYDLAIDFLNKAIEMREKAGNADGIDEYYTFEPAEYYVFRAITYSEKKDYDSAEADYTKCVELGGCGDYYEHRAWFYYEKKRDYDAAFADCVKAIERCDYSNEAYHIRARIYFYHRKDYDSAIADFTKAVESCGCRGCKACAKELYMCGRAYLIKGDYYNAVKSFITALKELLMYIVITLKSKCRTLIK